MATITDVCKLAGVSKATVSRVLNGTAQVKESTRRAVFDAIDQLGYRPNSLARALANNSANSLGLVVSDFEGAYFGTLLKQAALSAEEHGKQLIVTDGHDDPLRERDAVHLLADRRCDAIVLYSRFMSEAQLTELKAGLAIPLMVINRELPPALGPSVCFEQAGATRLMMDHLIGLGHRRIACITTPIRSPTGQARLEGYRTGLGAHGIAVDPQLIEHGDSHLEGGYLACRRLLERGVAFTALFAFNDDMAVGALRALHEAGIRVPQQLSVAGFDNEPMSAYSQPPLTTVELPIQAMTRHAMQLALELAEGRPAPAPARFRGRLVPRESVTAPNTSD